MYIWSNTYPDYKLRMKVISLAVKMYVNEDGRLHLELLPKE